LYGACVAECKAKVDCEHGYDCMNGICKAVMSGGGDNKPLPESCRNGVKDDDETDIDCGGSCAPCDTSMACAMPNDCASLNCTNGVCLAATCSDMIANGDESDVDCGGPACLDCVNGKDCTSSTDCASRICTDGMCVDPGCADGIENGDETDVDCGGSCAACDPTKGCNQGPDCTSRICAGGVCQQPSCSDGVQNGNEVDVDCGGACQACGTSKSCTGPADCASRVCEGGICLAPGCSDTVKNGSETDVDCGGPQCGNCADAAACAGDDDCVSGACVGNICTPTYVLSIAKAGTGSGIVEAAADGISCGRDCSKSFVSGRQITLTAQADGGSTFTGWQGAGCNGTGVCTASMNQAQVVTATFNANQVGAHSWSLSFGDNNYDRLLEVAVSNNGEVAVAGSFQNTINFGGGPLTASHQDDALIMKRRSDGTHAWSRRFGSSYADVAKTVAVDSQGNVLSAGSMYASFSLGGGALPCTNAAYFAKYASADGAHLWSRCTGSSPAFLRSVVDSTDNFVSAGHTVNGAADFGGGAIGTFGSGDAVIVKYRGTDGGYLWAKRYGGSAQDYARGLAIGPNDELYLCGGFESDMNIGGQGLLGVGNYDIYVTKLTAAGDHIWSKSFGDSFRDEAYDIAVGPQGDVVIVGEFRGTVDFGGGPLTSQGSTDIFVVKLRGNDGAFIWATRFGASDADRGGEVEIHANGEIVVSGIIGSNVDFGAGPLTNSGQADIFVARFSSAGAVIWANSYGTSGNDSINGLALDGFGSPVIAGEFPRPINFGGGILPHVGLGDMFISKLTP